MVEMQGVTSSNISEVGYDDEARELWITFNSGQTYIYSGTPREIYEGLLASPSPGSYVHRQVRDVYRARKA